MIIVQNDDLNILVSFVYLCVFVCFDAGVRVRLCMSLGMFACFCVCAWT